MSAVHATAGPDQRSASVGYRPDTARAVIFTRDGCPHCARVKEILEQAGPTCIEFPRESQRARCGGARGIELTPDTVPQISLNGRLIRGADELEEELYGASGPPETRPT